MDDHASFGYWIRRRRKALDLTQDALAAQVNCSVTTIRKIEADERRPSRQMAELLANVLAIAAQGRANFLKVARGEWQVERLADAIPVTSSPVSPLAVVSPIALPPSRSALLC